MSPDGANPEDANYDVVVVGSGAAGMTAAVVAARKGATVLVFEAGEGVGGTTVKSSGGMWVPRNRFMRARAESDHRFVEVRDNCLAHMARLSYPDAYRRDAERHGLEPRQWDLIVNYYDSAAEVFEDLESNGELKTMMLESFRGDDLGWPTWHETEEDGNTYGRLRNPAPFEHDGGRDEEPFSLLTGNRGGQTDTAIADLGAAFGTGVDLILHLLAAALRYGVEVRTSRRVVDLAFDAEGEAAAVIVESPDGRETVEARRAIVFASGGMEHNAELRERFLRGPIVGTCGIGTNVGDLTTIAERHGLPLENMGEAWWAQLPLEPCLESFEQGELLNQNYGDSMILVDVAGNRVVNEKESYNERGKIHSVRAEDGSYPYRILIQVFDDAVVRDPSGWPGRWPVPVAPDVPDYILRSDTLEGLGEALAGRLEQLADETKGLRLALDFTSNLKATIERFNAFARAGNDEDFARGATWAQRYFSVEFRQDPQPNFTMYPIADTGPYYAVLLGASCLGTKGGPGVDVRSQVLGADGTPIGRLYGAGNCVGSPTGEAYWGGGSTLGPAIVHGWLAGRNASADPNRSAALRLST